MVEVAGARPGAAERQDRTQTSPRSAPDRDGDDPQQKERAPDPLLGLVLDGGYRLIEQIGSGGYGVVYKARRTQPGLPDRDVAIKILRRGGDDDSTSATASTRDHAAEFWNEARIIASLKHPNTIKLLDFGLLPDGRPFLVTSLLEGRTLAACLAQGPLEPLRVVRVLAQICGSLQEAHELGVIHRDLKPSNVVLHRAGQDEIVTVLDFGVAQLPGVAPAEGKRIGTPAYMSPEQATGAPLDPRSDLYSLGVLAYECLTGRVPFDKCSTTSLLKKHRYDAPTPLSRVALERRPPRSLERIVMRLLEKDRPSDWRARGRCVTSSGRSRSSCGRR